ncbi:MAG: efflux RND transporter permease subunit [Acidobacteriota bacterium]
MLTHIIKWSLENRLLVVAIASLILVYGVWVVVNLPVDVLPDLNRPTVTIMTEAEGLAPEEVETLVTFPIETLMNGAPGVERVRSQSGIGLSIVWVEFEWGTDIYIDRQLVAEKLNLAREQLPDGIAPVMGPISSIMGEIMLVSVRSKSGQTDPLDVRTLADWTIRPRLLTIPGIAQVTNIGGGVKQYQALVSPAKLQQFGITIEQVAEALEKSNANTTGGFVDSQSQEYLIRNIARFNSLDELKNVVVVYRNGTPIKLDEVAKVEFGAKIKRGEGGTDAKPAVIMAISKQPGADTLILTKKVENALKELQATSPADIEINSELFRQASFIRNSIENVIEALTESAVLVIIILFLFLLNFRTTAITLTAIPLSFVMAFLVFKWFGITINTMTLGGLAVAIGELVDDSIVDIENIFRRLRENRLIGSPKPAIRVIYEASMEVRSSIVYATFIVGLVFIPLFALTGVEGRLLVPLGVAYIVSLLASLIVSLTVTPVLASYFLPQAKIMQSEKEGFIVRTLKRWDEPVLRWTLRHPWKVMGGAAALFLATISILPFVGTEFLPAFNEGTLTINVLAQPGTSLAESNKIGQVAEQLILSVPEVIATGRRTGRAELDEHAEGVHYSEIDVDLKRSERGREVIINELREKLAIIPGVNVNIGQPISHRIDHLMSGIRAQIAIKLFGDDLAVLRSKAEEIRNVVSTVSGTTDVQIEKQVLIPQLRFQIDRNEAARYGLRPGEVVETLETALNGRKVSEAIEGQRRYDVVVRFDDESRNNLDALRNATIDTPAETQLPVATVANIIKQPGPNQVLRENTQRRIVIMANTSGRDLGSVVKDIQSRIKAQVTLPERYFIEYGGQFEAQQDATRRLTLLSVFSLIAIFFLLIKGMRDWRAALQVMINVPLALIGAIIAMLLTGGIISVATLVGFISLVGITARNGIMMISHYMHLMHEEGEGFTEEMIIRGSLERLVPVLMTAVATILSVIPLVLSAGEPGKEILEPMAIVVLGGIITSTLLDQLVTPAVFYKFGKPIAEKIFNEKSSAKVEEKDEAGQDLAPWDEHISPISN